MIGTKGRKNLNYLCGGDPMQRWEYNIRKTDFKVLNQPSFLELERTRLSEHGEEGWELVSVVPSQNGDSLIMFLKRPVEDPGSKS
jgi:hypothetical protein